MASPYAKIRKAYGGIPADAMLQEVLPLEELAALARNQANKVVSEDQPGTYKQKNRQSESFSIAGPASNEEIIPMLKLSGFKMKDDGTVDMDQFKSRQIPELEELKKFQMSRPSEPNLEGLAMALSALGGTEVKAPKRDRTADMNLKDYAELGSAIQNQRDEEMKRQSDLFKAITGVTSVRQSGTKVDDSDVTMTNPQPSAPRAASGVKPPKNLTPAQLKEIQLADDAIAGMKGIKNTLGNKSNWVGFFDRLRPEAISSAERNAFRSDIGRLFDKYRALTTGAAAPFAELQWIMDRLPQEKDSFETFKAKADTVINEFEKAKARRLQGYSGLGYNVTGLSQAPEPNKPPSQDQGPAPKTKQQIAKEILEKRKAQRKSNK